MPVAQLIHLTAAPEHRARMIELLRANVAASRQEPGCLRFDMAEAEGGEILLWEVFRDQAALEAHWGTPHFLAFSDWMKGLPEGAVTKGRTALTPLAD